MEFQNTYKLHDQVRFLQYTDYAVMTHLGHGAWFKIVPWVVDALNGLGTGPLDEHVSRIAETYGQPEDRVRQFFGTLGQSGMIEVCTAADVPMEPRPNHKLESVVWRANGNGSGDTLFSEQVAVQFVDTLIMSGVQRIALEGNWLARDDVSDIVSLAQMVSGFVMLSADDTVFSPEACARLENVPELIEVQATDVHPAEEGDHLASTRRALATLRDNHFYSLRVRAPLRDLKATGLGNVFQALDSVESSLNLASLLPSDRDALCMAGQLSDSSIGAGEVVDLFKEHLAHEISTFNLLGLQWLFDRSLKRSRCNCGAGQCFVVVESCGSIYPCLSLVTEETRIGEWREGEVLSEVLAQSPVVEALRRRNVENIPGCRDCDVRYFCGGGCPANALRAGDIMGKDPLCPVYQKLLRAAITVWRDDKVLEDNFAAMVEAL